MERSVETSSKSATTIPSSERWIKIHHYENLNNNDNEPSSRNRQSSKVSSISLYDGKAKSSRATTDPSGSISVSTSKSESSFPSYNVDQLSSRQIHESLIRLRKNAIQPFTFLNRIFDEKTWNDNVPTERIEPTEIDLQLAALTRRVRLNKSLLERTNQRVKEINFLVERNTIITANEELNYDEEESKCIRASGEDLINNESSLNIACPGMMELKRTINVTKDMLACVKKICNNEMGMKDLPEEFMKHMHSRTLTETEDGIRRKALPVASGQKVHVCIQETNNS